MLKSSITKIGQASISSYTSIVLSFKYNKYKKENSEKIKQSHILDKNCIDTFLRNKSIRMSIIISYMYVSACSPWFDKCLKKKNRASLSKILRISIFLHDSAILFDYKYWIIIHGYICIMYCAWNILILSFFQNITYSIPL